MLGIEGKVIVVSGGNHGIGACIVEVLHEWGAKVAYNYRSEPGLEIAGEVLAVKADVTDCDAMENLYVEAEKELGEVYGLVANAGVIKDSLTYKMPKADWDYVVNINLTGVFNTVQPYLRRKCVKSNAIQVQERADQVIPPATNGAIVVISSLGGQRGNIGQANYAASKGGVIALTKTWAMEAARYGVRCNSVAPGYTQTDIIKGIPDKVVARLVQEVPLRRFADPKEMAWAAGFLLSPMASTYITGQTIGVNGGQYMSS
jgi:acetoacetyl-CoA reductase/3-oxoacyl-[acyl-carrier protein] reductase